MIEKPKRPKKIPNQDNKQPQTIQELIKRYDLDNTKIYDFLDELVGSLKQTQTSVSVTEPTGENREKVWIQKSRNQFNINEMQQVMTSKDTDLKSSASYTKLLNGVRINSIYNYQYTFVLFKLFDLSSHRGKPIYFKTNWLASGNNNGAFSIGLCNEDGSIRNSIIEATTSGTEISMTIPQDLGTTKYFALWLNANNTGAAVAGDYIDYTDIMLTIGEPTGEYEEHVTPTIYIKNDNDVYEEFISKDNLVNYSTGEQRIGTWVDGKPLYRMIIEGTLSSTEDTTTIDLGEKIIPRNFYGDIYYSTLKLFLPLNYANPNASIYTYISDSNTNSTVNIVTSNFKGCDYMIVIEYIKN